MLEIRPPEAQPAAQQQQGGRGLDPSAAAVGAAEAERIVVPLVKELPELEQPDKLAREGLRVVQRVQVCAHCAGAATGAARQAASGWHVPVVGPPMWGRALSLGRLQGKAIPRHMLTAASVAAVTACRGSRRRRRR